MLYLSLLHTHSLSLSLTHNSLGRMGTRRAACQSGQSGARTVPGAQRGWEGWQSRWSNWVKLSSQSGQSGQSEAVKRGQTGQNGSKWSKWGPDGTRRATWLGRLACEAANECECCRHAAREGGCDFIPAYSFGPSIRSIRSIYSVSLSIR